MTVQPKTSMSPMTDLASSSAAGGLSALIFLTINQFYPLDANYMIVAMTALTSVLTYLLPPLGKKK
jgi:hypothetical protein